MDEEIKVLVADVSEDMDDTIAKVTGLDSRIKVVDACFDGEAAIKKALELKPDIILLDRCLPGTDGISVTEILVASIPNVIIIITSDQKGKHNTKKAMAAGARRFIAKPFTARTITNTIVSLFKSHKEKMEIIESMDIDGLLLKPKVIAIFSTKGGVGKTMVSANLAAELARSTKEKVALLDFDFQFGDIPILLNLYPKKTIMDLVDNIEKLDKELLEAYLTESQTGVKVLSAPMGPEFSEYITPQVIEKVIKVLKESYKYIVIDTAPSFNDANLAALDAATNILFITTLELHTIKDTKSGMKVLNSLGYENERTLLILNRYQNNFGLSPKDLSQAVGKEVAYIIPEDAATVVDSINSGKPFVTSNANGQLDKSLKNIAAHFIEDKKSSGDTKEKKFLWW